MHHSPNLQPETLIATSKSTRSIAQVQKSIS